MQRFSAIVSGLARRIWGRRKCAGLKTRNLLVMIALAFVLAAGSPSLAQTRGREQPPRPQHKTYPWPWFLGFVLLGIAWYPAFKNSKRELER